jgi:tetratricopeptide (TPR) repeat protein
VSARVPFRLHRRPGPAPAAAVLLGSDDPAALLAACAHLSDPIVFPVAGGFLVVAESIPAGVPGAVRLRRLSENAYLPADADLVPALWPAEVVDLTARRGLVFLPHQNPLAFDPARPLRPAAFLAVPKPARADWEPFPAGSPLAASLTAITRVLPEIDPEDLLSAGGPPVGTDEARPPRVGPGRAALGRASLGLGKGLGALGKALGSKKLGELGGKLAGLGAALAPRLSESLLGKQEAALQSLLRKFRSGDTDDALRRSIPIGTPGLGGSLYGSDRLPTHSLRWSFAGLFGGSGGSSQWAGGRPETWRDLIAEYHRAAQQAADRGDFRRAALIYVRLLGDYRAAAEALARGGLHREAGILFRDKARQLDRAAQEFEKAGQPDEALRLYRTVHRYVEAGDLLRRLGEEERAVAEYQRAAEWIVGQGDHVQAGDILLKKTGRADLAAPYFARGWEARSASDGLARNAAACAGRLIEIHAFADPPGPFWQLLGEAEEWLARPGRSHDAGRFFNTVIECADLPHLRADRAEIRDRCRLGLAGALRHHARFEVAAGSVVSDLFGSNQKWSPAVVSDAGFALRAALRRPRPAPPADGVVQLIRLHAATVTAVVQAADSGDLFVGFQDGRIVRYQPEAGEVGVVHADRPEPIHGLAADPAGEWLAALRFEGLHPDGVSERHVLELRGRQGSDFRIVNRLRLETEPGSIYGLLPVIERDGNQPAIAWSSVDGVKWFVAGRESARWDPGPESPLPSTTHLKLRIEGPGSGECRLTFQGASLTWAGKRVHLGWMPDPVNGSTLFSPPVAWLVASPTHVELAGLFDNATLYWTEVRHEGRPEIHTLTHVAPGGFRAVCIWRSMRVVGVTATNRVVWLVPRSGRLAEWADPVVLPAPARAVACFPSRATREILVVLDDGSLARVPVPG